MPRRAPITIESELSSDICLAKLFYANSGSITLPA